MNDSLGDRLLTDLVRELDIPDHAYEAAESRYHDLGEWLRDESKAKIARFQPLVSAQGSFRMGTVTKPWKTDHHDLDIGCSLQEGITPETCTQYDLKHLVGSDLYTYRSERRIQDEPEEKHRCWRLNYQDNLHFHADVVPCVPHSERIQAIIKSRMLQTGTSALLAQDISKLAVAITDDRHSGYRRLDHDWYISNPEGYARWFESRMKQAHALLKSRTLQAKVGRIEDLPVFRWKTPLQAAIQILKRHRDVMYEKLPERKPISIIITTLAAHAYRGEFDLSDALRQILDNMCVNPSEPRVPNPVNPQEDFADRWKSSEGRALRLEENFFVWIEQAKRDFHAILSPSDYGMLPEHIRKRFGVSINQDLMRQISGTLSPRISSPALPIKREMVPKPWGR